MLNVKSKTSLLSFKALYNQVLFFFLTHPLTHCAVAPRLSLVFFPYALGPLDCLFSLPEVLVPRSLNLSYIWLHVILSVKLTWLSNLKLQSVTPRLLLALSLIFIFPVNLLPANMLYNFSCFFINVFKYLIRLLEKIGDWRNN